MKNKILFLSNFSDLKKYLIKIKYKFFLVDKNVFGFFKNIVEKNNFYLISSPEKSKNYFAAIKIIDLLLKRGYNKNIVFISIGGGAVSDLSGFISSIFFRGINYISIPTTLLSQVDASLGGKNGINTKFGKNLIGTIYFPKKIVVLEKFIFNLPFKIFLDGFSEIIKISLVNNILLFSYIESFKNLSIKKIIIFSILSKISIIKNNFLDSKLRFYLNFGHTFAHSIERCFDYKISHGKAVYTGIVISCYYSFLLNYLSFKVFSRIIGLLRLFFNGYLCIIKKLNKKDFFNNIRYDKKNDSNTLLKVILIKNIGTVFVKEINVKFISNNFSFKKISELVNRV